jgi:protein-S-isoprenylcysteine O-methyltransferase Ste14
VLVLWLATPTLYTLVLGTTVAVLGEALRIWAAGHLNKAQEVTTSGPYRWIAHPLYVGSAVMAIGLACNRVSVAVVVVAYMIVTVTAAVKDEVTFLRGRFGIHYDRYRRQGLVDDRRRFSFALVMSNREYRAVAGLALAVLLLAWKATYNKMF